MIERDKRDIAASALRDLLSATITNYEFERRYPRSRVDPAIDAIFTSVWFCYSDTTEHSLSSDVRMKNLDIAERCVTFLGSDLEFEWPQPKISLWFGFLRLLGAARAMKDREERRMSRGDKEWWPFLSRHDYEREADRSRGV